MRINLSRLGNREPSHRENAARFQFNFPLSISERSSAFLNLQNKPQIIQPIFFNSSSLVPSLSFLAPTNDESLTDEDIDTRYKLPVGNKFNNIGLSDAYNYGTRNGETIDTIVIHNTVSNFNSTISTFLKKGGTSAHYVVDTDGKIYSIVDESLAAHHAGRPRNPDGSFKEGAIVNEWDGNLGLNENSIGIEIVNSGVPTPPGKNPRTWNATDGDNYKDQPEYTPAQIESVKKLCAYVMKRNRDIPPFNIIAHSDAKPEDKVDPGIYFPWQDFAKEGLGIYVKPAPLNTAGVTYKYTPERAQTSPNDFSLLNFQLLFIRAGYSMIVPDGVYTQKMQKVVKAFQLRHRPERVDGVLDPSTQKTLENYVLKLEEAKSAWQMKIAKV